MIFQDVWNIFKHDKKKIKINKSIKKKNYFGAHGRQTSPDLQNWLKFSRFFFYISAPNSYYKYYVLIDTGRNSFNSTAWFVLLDVFGIFGGECTES